MAWVCGDKISFITPVRYNCEASRVEKALAKVDSFLCWDDKVAMVTKCHANFRDIVPMKDELQQAGLKVAAFVGWGLSVAAVGKTLIGRQSWGPLQVVAGVVGIGGVGLLLAKAIFRRCLKFCELTYSYEAKPNDKILPEVKKTLDGMLGGAGIVDELPVFEGDEAPDRAEEMSAGIMKGIMRVEQGGRKVPKPYIIIELTRKSDDTKHVLTLYPHKEDAPQSWFQGHRGPALFYMNPFTDEKGQLFPDRAEAAGRLMCILTEGEGSDMDGALWTYGPSKEEEEK